MAERGKAEETQRTEAENPDAKLEETLENIRVIREYLERHMASEDPSDVEAKLASIPITVRDEHFLQAASRLNRPWTDLLPDLDVPFERDDAYYDEVRHAVGRGAPSVLLGTSTRSLKRGFRKLKTVRQADIDRPSSPASTQREQTWSQYEQAWSQYEQINSRVAAASSLAHLAALLRASETLKRQAQQPKKD